MTAPSPRVTDNHALIAEVMDAWSPALGAARAAYEGHAYRVYNFARALSGNGSHDGEIAVASAFHDIGIWTDETFDYLAPSVERASEFLRARRPDLSSELVAAAIENHHKLGGIREGVEPSVEEAFRRADLVDVSKGLFTFGLPRGFYDEVVAAFPYSGFHGILVRTCLDWWRHHPLRPLPMMKL